MYLLTSRNFIETPKEFKICFQFRTLLLKTYAMQLKQQKMMLKFAVVCNIFFLFYCCQELIADTHSGTGRFFLVRRNCECFLLQ
jgi:hypothetical protein